VKGTGEGIRVKGYGCSVRVRWSWPEKKERAVVGRNLAAVFPGYA
jgi:hypothetical protein